MRSLALAAAILAALPLAVRSEEPAALLIDEALEALAMTRADCRFRTDYADRPDSFRLSIVDSLLLSPLDTEPYVRELARAVRVSPTLADLVACAARELDLTEGGAQRVPDESGAALAVPRSQEPRQAVDAILAVLLPAVESAKDRLGAAFAPLSDDDMSFLVENAPELLLEDEFDPDRPIDEREAEAAEDEALGDSLLQIAGFVDYSAVADAGRAIAAAADALASLALALADSAEAGSETAFPGPPPDDPRVSGDVRAIAETPHGTLIVGGPGSTVYSERVAFVIDLGGDDLYRAPVGAARPGGVSIAIDAGGDDTYIAGDHSFGAGFAGVGVLVDLAGDDLYRAGSFALGSGLFGVGLLSDVEGKDVLAGDTCVEGAGSFGIGILSDGGGNDIFEGALFCQGFGFVRGFGLLADAGGNDVYFAGGKYTDEIRYFDHFLSLSQGFGYGWRPDASGGIGMLVDDGGNDVYVSDIFGQGSSYWFAVGGLVDRSGNDEYVSYQYAQGAATHITAAALVDLEGDDNYVSKGVSQGCGHDLAVGILHDLAGDDGYTCHDLSQAAGNANGIGVLLDGGGDDSYSVRNPDNTHGYGNLRRDYGSIAVFIDAGGSDTYAGRGADGTWWTSGTHGIGVDAEASNEGGRP